MSLDLRLVPVAAGLWASEAALTLTAGRPRGWLLGIAITLIIGVLLAGVAALQTSGTYRRILLIFACALLAGASLAVLRVVPLGAAPISEMAAHHAYVSVEAVITSPPRLKSAAVGIGNPIAAKQWSSSGELVAVTEAGARWSLAVPVRLSGRISDAAAATLIPGAKIRSQAVLREPMPARASAADVSMRGQPTVIAAAPPWQQLAQHVRTSMTQACVGLPTDAAGLLPGLVVGDDSGLAEDVRADMKLVGMSHLTAVSGSNLAIVTGMVLLLARAFRLPRRISVPIAGLALAAFVAVVGPQPSVLRAAVMGAIALIALFTGRPRSGITALAASVVLLLLIDPWLSSSVGFILSVCATAGLLAYAIRSQQDPDFEPEQTRSDRIRSIVRAALGVTLAAQLATAPVVAGLGSGVPIVGIPANLLAAVAVPPATVIGSAAALVASVAPGPGHALAVVAGYPAAWIAYVAQTSADVPGGVIPWPSGILGTLLMAGVLGGMYLGWRYRQRNPDSSPLALVVAAVLAVAAIGLIRPSPATGPWPAANWLAVVCDVGQGDGTVIATTPGHAIVVDVGPEPGPIDRCLQDLGVQAIDLLILTHFHVDHVEGLPGLLARRSVGRVIVSPLKEPVGEVERVTGWLKARGITAETAAAGEEGTIGTIRYQILWPTRIIRREGSDPNNSSVTTVFDIGDVRLLLPGDLEPTAQEGLIGVSGPIGADVVKIPHHGSRNQSPRLISWSGARLAIASAGVNNTYGHPSPQTLDAWRQSGAAVARTDEDGDVAIVNGPDSAVMLVPRKQADP